MISNLHIQICTMKQYLINHFWKILFSDSYLEISNLFPPGLIINRSIRAEVNRRIYMTHMHNRIHSKHMFTTLFEFSFSCDVSKSGTAKIEVREGAKTERVWKGGSDSRNDKVTYILSIGLWCFCLW